MLPRTKNWHIADDDDDDDDVNDNDDYDNNNNNNNICDRLELFWRI